MNFFKNIKTRLGDGEELKDAFIKGTVRAIKTAETVAYNVHTLVEQSIRDYEAVEEQINDTAMVNDQPKEKTALEIIKMFQNSCDHKTDTVAVLALNVYLQKNYHFTTSEAEALFDAIEKTGLFTKVKNIYQERVIDSTEDTRPGRGFLMNRPPRA